MSVPRTPAPSLESAGVSAQAALVASGHAFSVCEVGVPDFPLSWVNPAFEELTGYSIDDVAGQNCRFLRGPLTDPASSARIRAALEAGRPITETLLNYRKDGSTWWNRVIMTPVHDANGKLTHIVGVQSNVDAEMLAQQERNDALVAIRDAEARRYASEHAIAVALQRSLLPALPDVAGLEVAARYIPASDTAEVGGDWYDVLPLPDASTGIAIGDVMGHDLRAAASMGQLRSVLRSYAWEGYGPAEVMDRLNRLVYGLGMAQLATCIYARLEPGHAGRPATLHWSNAGHPPPMLRTPDGTVQTLTEACAVLIGATLATPPIRPRTDGRRDLPAGSTLLFYTDGLVEDRVHDIDEGMSRLRHVFANSPPATSVDALADDILDKCAATAPDDDICLLIVRLSD